MDNLFMEAMDEVRKTVDRLMKKECKFHKSPDRKQVWIEQAAKTAASLLSDAQFLSDELGRKQEANDRINLAKVLMSDCAVLACQDKRRQTAIIADNYQGEQLELFVELTK